MRRERHKYHITTKKTATSDTSSEQHVDSSPQKLQQLSVPDNLFAGIDISYETLCNQKLKDSDVRSVISVKSTSTSKAPTISKKEKRKLRHESFLKSKTQVLFHTIIINTFKYHVLYTDGKISVRINLLFYLYFPSSFHLTVVCFCPVKAYKTEISTVNCPSQETEVTSTTTRPVANVVLTTKGLQERNIQILDGMTMENKGKTIN